MSGRSSLSTLMEMKESFRIAGDAFGLKTLVDHDVAPMACAVADAEKDRLILLTGAGEGLFTPRIPVHRISGVLDKIEAGFGLEPVAHIISPSDSLRMEEVIRWLRITVNAAAQIVSPRLYL